MTIDNQNSAKWANHFLGKSKSGFQKYGCLLFCLSYLKGKQRGYYCSPDECNDILMQGGAFNGDLIDSVKAAKALGFEYLGKETDINKPPSWSPTIKEVRFSIKWGQHFVVRENGHILDPYGGVERAINFYEVKCGNTSWMKGGFSYRLFKPISPVSTKIKDLIFKITK